MKEWVCGRIGQGLNVPIPPFEVLYATATVARQSSNAELSDVASAPGVGSQFVDGATALNVADVPTVSDEVRRLVLLFDWWVSNEDRTDDNPVSYGSPPAVGCT